MSPTAVPPPEIIELALKVAARSPCRSKRGAVLYNAHSGAARGTGFNGPPTGRCPGRQICAGTCRQRSVHAEVRALRDVLRSHQILDPLDLIHVKLAEDGVVGVSGGPSCWQCSREILDVGFVGGVWLYEAPIPDGQRDWFAAVPLFARPEAWRRWRRWRRYTAEEFHRATLEHCGMVP